MGDVIELPIDGPTEPYTPHEISVLSRRIAKRLIQINEEQKVNNPKWVEAKGDLLRKRERAIWESFEQRPEAAKWVHEAYADAHTVDEAATAFYWERMVRMSNDEAHSLRQIQSWMQTERRIASELAGETGNGPRGRRTG